MELHDLIKKTSNQLAAKSVWTKLSYCHFKDFAKDITLACDLLMKVADGKPIVILGRDTEPLFWILKERGYPSQYFVFSRTQAKDKNTFAAIKKEVAKGSMVVDTGYHGTIINWVKTKGKVSVKGMLIHTSTNSYNTIFAYGDVPPNSNHTYRFCNWLEYFPKIIARPGGMTNRGSIVLSEFKVDDMIHCSYDEAIAARELLCAALGVRRGWARYTGRTRSERLNGIIRKRKEKAPCVEKVSP